MQTYRFQRLFKLLYGVTLLTAVPVLSSQADDTIQPGQWRTKEEVLEIINPLLPPEMIEKRKSTSMTVEFFVRSSSLESLFGCRER
ncbi:MAG: hypothetical protein U0236_13930 [Nitrospira sp.]